LPPFVSGKSEAASTLFVTAGDGRIVGIVSSLDVLRWLSRELPTGEGVAGAETD